MIEIMESEYKRGCSSCYSDTDVKELEISRELFGNRTGNIVALCRDCRDKLISVLLAELMKEAKR